MRKKQDTCTKNVLDDNSLLLALLVSYSIIMVNYLPLCHFLMVVLTFFKQVRIFSYFEGIILCILKYSFALPTEL